MPIVNKNNLHFSLVTLLLVAISVLFLVACETPLPQETLPATIASNVVVNPPEPTATERPSNTIMETAVPITPTTKPPVHISPTPLVTETHVIQVHEVQLGENLTIIANKFGTTTESIQRANEIVNGDTIYVGQELEIPTEAATVGVLAGNVSDRGILHNQILCPTFAEIEELDLEGGKIIGQSAVCQIPILSYQFGEGETSLILVGGMHGGYEWNTILLAYAFLDYLHLNPEIIPDSLSIIVIPNANPDGLYAVTRRAGRFTADDVDDNIVPGRFNGNLVDLNRNWDCEWTPNGAWGNNQVSGGSAPFSEPENQSLRNFILAAEPAAAVLFHSAAAGVYASGCGQIDPASEVLTTVYSQASGYPANAGFQHYEITGDASNWLAMQGIPAITVELTTHEFIDWRMNLAGLNALIDHIAPHRID